MADNFHKTYTASDIEKYWKGLLSPAEMHAMEKAAMDDPFLADAMEGYQHTTAAAAIDLDALRKRLHQRITPSRNFQWMKIAASVILIAGIAYASYQLSLKESRGPVSQELKEQKATAADTTLQAPANEIAQQEIRQQRSDTGRRSVHTPSHAPVADSVYGETISDQFLNIDRDRAKVIEDQKINTQPISTPSAPVFNDSAVLSNETSTYRDYKNDKEAANKPSAGLVTENAKGKKVSTNLSGFVIHNKFMGRVVDANNQPIPFANVTNTRDNVGTYTNLNGDFNLLSADSTLDLRIKSVGYEPKNFRYSPRQNQAVVVLADDPFTRDDVAKQNISRLKLTPRQQQDSLEEEVEDIAPEVGWDYYNRYIANNIKLPSTKAANPTRDVELSFQVDKYGNPTNIKITRSSKCKECDQAAIQVLRDGPKWKRGSKRSRTSVTISVDQ